MVERTTQLRVIHIVKTSPGLVECVLWNFQNPVQVGDTLCIESAAEGPLMDVFKILEVVFFGHLLDELPTNYSAQLLMASSNPERLRVGQLLCRCQSRDADSWELDDLLASGDPE